MPLVAHPPQVHSLADVDEIVFPLPPRQLVVPLTLHIHTLLHLLSSTLPHHARLVHQQNLERIQRPLTEEELAERESSKDEPPALFGEVGEATKESMRQIGGSAAGAAIEAAITLMAPTGGTILVFLATRPGIGRGKLADRFDSSNVGNDKETTLIDTPETFYKDLIKKCVDSQTSINIFAFPHEQYLDLASIAPLCEHTGGSLLTFPSFNIFSPVSSCHSLSAAVASILLDQRRGMESVIRLRCSRAVVLKKFYGHFHSETANLLSLPTITQASAFGVELGLDESMLSMTQTCIYIQASCLFTTIKGERRIRLHNLRLPLVDSLLAMYGAFDSQAALSLQTKKAAEKMLNTPLSLLTSEIQQDTARAFANYIAAAAADPHGADECVRIGGGDTKSMSEASSTVDSQIDSSSASWKVPPIPDSLRSYILYLMALEKSPMLRLGMIAPALEDNAAAKGIFLSSLYPFSFAPLPIANSIAFDSALLASLPPEFAEQPEMRSMSIPFSLTPSLAICADGKVGARHYLFESGTRKTLCFLYPRLFRIDTFTEYDCEDIPILSPSEMEEAEKKKSSEKNSTTGSVVSEKTEDTKTEQSDKKVEFVFQKPPLLRLSQSSLSPEGVYLFFSPLIALLYFGNDTPQEVKEALCVPTESVLAVVEGERLKKDREAREKEKENQKIIKRATGGDESEVDEMFAEMFPEDSTTETLPTIPLYTVCPFRPSFVSTSSSPPVVAFLSTNKRHAKWQLAPAMQSPLSLKLHKLIYHLTREFCDNSEPVTVFVVEAGEDFDESILSHLLLEDTWITQTGYTDYVAQIMALSKQI